LTLAQSDVREAKTMVSFSYPNLPAIQLPGPSDMAALMQIGRLTLFPDAKPLDDSEAREYFQQFVSAFGFIACLSRTVEFQGRAGDWCTRVEGWHAARGNSATSVSLAPFMTAVLAAGDVSWQAPRDRWPYDVFCGLAWSGGRPATAGWRTVLEAKLCLVPTPVKQSPYPAPHPLIYAG
jgi:hypothetical protein